MMKNNFFSIVKSIIFILLSSSLFCLTSCESDPCEGIVCVSGFCQDGTCICLDDYTGQFCQIAPLPPEQEPCEVNNTGQLRCQNKSTTGKTYDIIVDGVRRATLSPTEFSQLIPLSAGFHNVIFRIANSNNNACNPANVGIIQCEVFPLSCSN